MYPVGTRVSTFVFPTVGVFRAKNGNGPKMSLSVLRTRLLPALLGLLFLASSAFGRPARPPLFKASASAPASPDTLEVFCIYVQFQDETDVNDEATTTGRGVFGSDKDVKYTLDPNGSLRSYEFYLDKHFEFARNYFEKVSNGRVTVTSRIFPKPDADGHVE